MHLTIECMHVVILCQSGTQKIILQYLMIRGSYIACMHTLTSVLCYIAVIVQMYMIATITSGLDMPIRRVLGMFL